jgi:hypothetical protein
VTLFWILVIPFLIALAAATIVDLFRHAYGGWAKAAWVLFIVCLPVIGSLAYWIARRPAENEAELAYQAQADMRHQTQRMPIDRSGL